MAWSDDKLTFLNIMDDNCFNSKTGNFALFQKKNVSEEVFTDMFSSLASLYNDKDTPPIHYD